MPNILFLLIFSVALGLSGCASQAHRGEKSPHIDRISEEEQMLMLPTPLALLSLDDLVKLSKDGVTAEKIIEKIKQTHSLYDLSPSQSIALHQQGVDHKVLDYMHESHELSVKNNIADEINKRDKINRDALEKLKRQQLQQPRLYDPFCGYVPYGIHPYGYGGYYGRRFGLGAGFGWPLGCW